MRGVAVDKNNLNNLDNMQNCVSFRTMPVEEIPDESWGESDMDLFRNLEVEVPPLMIYPMRRETQPNFGMKGEFKEHTGGFRKRIANSNVKAHAQPLKGVAGSSLAECSVQLRTRS